MQIHKRRMTSETRKYDHRWNPEKRQQRKGKYDFDIRLELYKSIEFLQVGNMYHTIIWPHQIKDFVKTTKM